MKIIIIYIWMIVLSGIAFTYIIDETNNPEKVILGNWNELSWEYEKAKKTNLLSFKDTMPGNIKNQLGKNLVIHTAENWHFYSDGTLILKGKTLKRKVLWRIKGRGNILEIKYGNSIIEHYNLTELTNKTMILNFDSDMQVRGIAKLKFEKS